VDLDWSDLLIDTVAADELATLLEPWSSIVQGRVAPLLLNRFGAWFLLREGGEVVELDVLSGELAPVADSHAAFVAAVNTPAWQETHLHSAAVAALHVTGKVAAGTDCYVIAPPPRLGGPSPSLGAALPPDSVSVVSLRVCQSLCRQVLGGPA
jgi:hypothetical protein